MVGWHQYRRMEVVKKQGGRVSMERAANRSFLKPEHDENAMNVQKKGMRRGGMTDPSDITVKL